MDTSFAKKAYLNFFFWGVCSSLGVTVSTMVEAVLVGNFVGSNGLAVSNLATPVFLVYSLFGITLGVGANVLIGRKLGASKVEEANRIFNAQVLTGLIIGAACLLVSVAFSEQLLSLLGAEGALRPLAKQYLTLAFFSAPVFVLYHILSVSVRTDGDPKLTAAAAATVITVNLVLDLLFLQWFRWGIFGASVSFCVAEILGLLVLLTHFTKKHALLRFRFVLPKRSDIKRFVANGFGIGSGFVFQAIVMLSFNTLLLKSSSENGVMYVAVFGVIYTMGQFAFAVFEGAGNAVSAVVSIFAGEKDGKSMFTVLRQAVKTVLIAGALLTLGLILGAETIMKIYGIPNETLLFAVPAFRLFSLSIVFTGINMLVTAFWQAIGRARLASLMSILRNFVVMLLLGFALIGRFEILGLGLTYVCGEAVCFLGMMLVLLFRNSKSFVSSKYQSPQRVFEKCYVIEPESVAEISSDLQLLCGEWKMEQKQAFFINLIIEELLLNIIKFALENVREKHYIAIKLMEDSDGCMIRIRDNVSTYNPLESSGDRVDNAALKMIMEKSKVCDYQRKLIFNYLYLVI